MTGNQAEHADVGAEIIASTPEQYHAYLKSELAKFAKLVKAAGIRATGGGKGYRQPRQIRVHSVPRELGLRLLRLRTGVAFSGKLKQLRVVGVRLCLVTGLRRGERGAVGAAEAVRIVLS